jgi:uncharacterized repeat protein (TIGR03803 family)
MVLSREEFINPAKFSAIHQGKIAWPSYVSSTGLRTCFLGGSLYQASDSMLYGTTAEGGTYQNGSIFRYDIYNHTYTNLVNLDSSTGDLPYFGPLTEYIPQSVGIKPITTEVSSVFPNPITSNNFDIRMTENTLAIAISLEDISGRIIDYIQTSNTGVLVHVQTTNKLSAGLYIYNVIGADGYVVSKGKVVAVR